MKMLIISHLWYVGMQLSVGAGYKLQREEENPKDPNAVCVLDGPHKKAYLKRENAFIVSKLMTGIIKLLVT